MEQRQLGTTGLDVSALGLGCMGMSAFYGTTDEREAVAAIHRAIELGVTLLDTAEMYGPYTNEELVGRAVADRRDAVTIATKFGVRVDPEDSAKRVLDGSPANVRRSAEGSLRRLGADHIDLYYQHRVDPNVPTEETVGVLSELVTEGKIRYIGLSEASPETVRRANAVHPIAAVQTEYSLWSREVEDEVLPTLRELGIGLVAYSPLGRGFLSGRFRSPEDLDADDWRRTQPRFSRENTERNRALAEKVAEIAREKGVTPAQLALAWVLARGDDVVPIPGTKRRTYVEQNVGALEVELTSDDLARIEAELPAAAGERYDEAGMATLNA
jgi:aryl-alcohol dehydrogenase-like predicted oxidoreductase